MSEASGPAYYERSGHRYAERRQADPRIAAQIHAALGDARRVLNVGAGAGSYEPTGRDLVAVEPAAVMIAQRRPGHPCVRAVAEHLPFADRSFDAVMATLTIHHWTDWRSGLAEAMRVAPRVVLLTHDTAAEPVFWLCDYFPGILERDRERMPPPPEILAVLGGRMEPVPVPADCTDGFLGAFWRDPSAYLDPAVRASMSGFGLLDPVELADGLERLEADLHSGEWDRRFGRLRELESLDIGYRLVIA